MHFDVRQMGLLKEKEKTRGSYKCSKTAVEFTRSCDSLQDNLAQKAKKKLIIFLLTQVCISILVPLVDQCASTLQQHTRLSFTLERVQVCPD